MSKMGRLTENTPCRPTFEASVPWHNCSWYMYVYLWYLYRRRRGGGTQCKVQLPNSQPSTGRRRPSPRPQGPIDRRLPSQPLLLLRPLQPSHTTQPHPQPPPRLQRHNSRRQLHTRWSRAARTHTAAGRSRQRAGTGQCADGLRRVVGGVLCEECPGRAAVWDGGSLTAAGKWCYCLTSVHSIEISNIQCQPEPVSLYCTCNFVLSSKPFQREHFNFCLPNSLFSVDTSELKFNS